MERRVSIFLIVMLFVVPTGCDNFLDKDPQAILETETFFNSQEDAIKAVNGIYDKLNKRYTSNRSLWAMNDLPTPDTEAPTSETTLALIDNFTFGTTSEDIDNLWIECYEAIARANLAIKYIPGINMEKDLRDRLTGESRFLRGWFYLILVSTYGEVPLVMEPLEADDKEALTQEKASFDQIYQAIESDFQYADETLPWSYSADDRGRATRGAAKAYLAKSYLFREQWGMAAAKAGEVIAEAESNGTYTLLPSFREATWGKNTAEAIFEMQSVSGTGGWEDENEGNTITVWHRPGCMGGWGLHYGTQELADAFEPGDPRKRYTLLAPGDSYNGQVLPEGCLPANRYPLLKLMGDPDFGDGSDANASQNFVFMRFAEVYLIKAEAEAELGNLAEAEKALEAVRSRARNDQLAGEGALPELTGLSQEDLIEAIRRERRVELATEMKRFPDLRRWGLAAEVNQEDGKAFVEGKHEYFPIPQTQIDLSEGNLTQNDGY